MNNKSDVSFTLSSHIRAAVIDQFLPLNVFLEKSEPRPPCGDQAQQSCAEASGSQTAQTEAEICAEETARGRTALAHGNEVFLSFPAHFHCTFHKAFSFQVRIFSMKKYTKRQQHAFQFLQSECETYCCLIGSVSSQSVISIQNFGAKSWENIKYSNNASRIIIFIFREIWKKKKSVYFHIMTKFCTL